MKKIYSLIIAISLACPAMAFAAPVFDISDVTVASGANTFDLNIDLTGDASYPFDNFTLSLQPENGLTLTGVSYGLLTAPSQWVLDGGDWTDSGMSGFMFGAYRANPNLGSPISTDMTPLAIMSFSFTDDFFASSNSVKIKFADWVITDPGGNSYNDLTSSSFLSGTVTSAVPIPGAVWLLGSGLAGMVAMRRKKK